MLLNYLWVKYEVKGKFKKICILHLIKMEIKHQNWYDTTGTTLLEKFTALNAYIRK